MSQTELAKLFGVTVQTVRRWVIDGLPRNGEGRGAKYPRLECLQWREEQVRQQERGKLPPADSLDEAKRRKVLAEAQMAELDLGRVRGDLMTVEQYDSVVSQAYQRVAQRLKTIAPRLAPDVIGIQTLKEAKNVLDAEVRALMKELHGENGNG